MFTDAVAVVSLSLFTALLSEGRLSWDPSVVRMLCDTVAGVSAAGAALSWFLVHRTDSYKRRRDAIDRLQKKGGRPLSPCRALPVAITRL